MVIGLLTIAAIPTVTGIGQATGAQQRENEAAGKKQAKFNLTADFYTSFPDVKFPNPQYIILKNGRVSSPFLTIPTRLCIIEERAIKEKSG